MNLDQRVKRIDCIQDYIQNDFKSPHITYNNPSTIRIFCPYCGEEYSGDKSFLCKQALCKRCSRRFIVGQSPETDGLNIPRNKMTINEYMLVANGCKLMGNLQTARRMTAEALADNAGWIKGHYFLASADILLHNYDEAAKSLFTYIECLGCSARKDMDNYYYIIENLYGALASPFWGTELQIGPFLLPKNYYYHMLFNERGEIDSRHEIVRLLLDCVFMLIDFSEAFEYLGHCYIHKYPNKFKQYPSLFGDVSDKFESAIHKNPPREPAGYPTHLKHISCITGLSYALANISRYESMEDVLKAAPRRWIKDMAFFCKEVKLMPGG